jgi:hypothetical protein
MEATKRKIMTADEVLKQQMADAEPRPVSPPEAALKPSPTANAVIPQSAGGSLPALPDTRTKVERFLDEEAPNRVVGRLVQFSKDGEFVISDTEEVIAAEREFLALGEETLIEWIKFNGEGVPPTQIAGLLYSDFELPPREALGDLDEAQWPLGLSGKTDDPWKRGTYIVLQDVDTHELFTFITRSKTGRIAAATLLRHYERLKKSHPGECPIVRLKVGGFEHKDTRVGWVKTPVFVTVGHAKADTSSRPDTSLGGEDGDSIPF